MWQRLLDFIFPRKSLGEREGEWITPGERRMLRTFPVREETAQLRKRGIRSLDRLVAGCTYGGSPMLRKAIWSLKFGRIRALVPELARLIEQVAPPTDLTRPVLCPVPLHWSRRFHRGFNQAELLAQSIGRSRGLQVTPLLGRVRSTGYQSHRKSEDDRRSAVRDAFVFRGAQNHDYVVLIDDLSTTGATLDACAKVLKASGVKRVDAWVVAHG